MRRSAVLEGDEWFPEVGVSLSVLEPGKPSGLYHAEPHQEGFLILSGECLLLIEGEERRLGPWDYVHCPAGAEHVLVGAGSGPCVYIAIGGRDGPAGVPLSGLRVRGEVRCRGRRGDDVAPRGVRGVPAARPGLPRRRPAGLGCAARVCGRRGSPR